MIFKVPGPDASAWLCPLGQPLPCLVHFRFRRQRI